MTHAWAGSAGSPWPGAPAAGNGSPAGAGSPTSSLADVTERLMAEFAGTRTLDVISALVGQAARDLSGTGAGPWGELLERCARQRLLDLDAEGPRLVPAVPSPRPRASAR
jgi:hypothetical protein